VARVRQRFVEEGFEAALNPRPRPRGAYKLTPEMESHIVALAKNDPPKGRKRWTLRLIWSRVTPRRGRCGWCWTT
ncbi:MAG: helix-turn-helix domain-containing protein, partial [Planctomycetes bacterium]|nr:helix-turn-helix domain-containing protein [Planctomycetota bacterium]